MRLFEFSLDLPVHKIERIYQGNARYILVESDGGLTLQLPATNFREYVDTDGIHGRFRVHIDENNRIINLRRL